MQKDYIFTDALYKETNFEKRVEFVKYKIDSLNLPDIKCKAQVSPIVVMADLTPEAIYKYVDLTAVKPQAGIKDIETLCQKGLEKQCFGVCVNQVYAEDAKKLLGGSQVKVIATVDFPFGASTAETKAFQALKALESGADELDMVLNISLLKSGRYAKIYEEIRMVADTADEKPVKVIIETCYLKDEEKIIACLLSRKAGAAFVKTSTGFGTGGADAGDIKLIRDIIGRKMGLKASGGINNFETAKLMIQSGSNRIGTSTIFK